MRGSPHLFTSILRQPFDTVGGGAQEARLNLAKDYYPKIPRQARSQLSPHSLDVSMARYRSGARYLTLSKLALFQVLHYSPEKVPIWVGESSRKQTKSVYSSCLR